MNGTMPPSFEYQAKGPFASMSMDPKAKIVSASHKTLDAAIRDMYGTAPAVDVFMGVWDINAYLVLAIGPNGMVGTAEAFAVLEAMAQESPDPAKFSEVVLQLELGARLRWPVTV